jgi:hypothetical protein
VSPGGRFFPYIPIHFFGQDTDLGIVIVWVIFLVIAAVVLAVIGYNLGSVLGGGGKRTGQWQPGGAAGSAAPGQTVRDMILNPAEVAGKATQTTLLMEFLARRDPRLEPASLRSLVTDTFCRVQQCWEARDYGPVSHLLCPGLRAAHEELLRQMRAGHEINRIEGLRAEAVDFVQLCCPKDPDAWAVAALITFQATVYFVNDRDGSYTRGSRSPGLFQEFWVFRRQGERWLLQAIERTHQSDRLQAANHVVGLSAEQLQNMQHSIAL